MTKRHAINPTALPALLKADKPQHATDGGGLFLLTTGAPKRAGSWRYEFKSPVTGKRSKITLGGCWLDTDGKTARGMTAAEARSEHVKAREMVQAGSDPVQARDAKERTAQDEHAAKVAQDKDNRERKARGLPAKDSFADLTLRWLDASRNRWGADHIRNVEKALKRHAFPLFGDKHIEAVTDSDIAALDKALKATRQTCIKARGWVRQVFEYAALPEVKARTTPHPVFRDSRLWDGLKSKPRAAQTKATGAREVLLQIWGPEGNATLKQGLKLMALTAQRTVNIAQARKEEFDLDAATWTIPPVKMKQKKALKDDPETKPHIVYLSRQAVQLVREQFAAHPHSAYVFPGQSKATGRAMGKTSMSGLIRRWFPGQQSGHGFRSMFRTIAPTLGCNPLHCEAVIAHCAAIRGLDMMRELANMMDGGMPGVYDRIDHAENLPKVMQVWADWIDEQLGADDGLQEQPMPHERPALLAIAA
jgi:integrase